YERRRQRLETHLAAARAYRREEERRCRRRQQEDRAAGRLLERLQERVLAVLVHLVRPVDDAHLPPRHERREREPTRELPDLLGADVLSVGVADDHAEVRMRTGD